MMLPHIRAAYQAGYNRCWDGGENCDNPYVIGDVRWVAWAKGFEQAHEEMEVQEQVALGR